MKKSLLVFLLIVLVYSCKKTESLAPNTYEIKVTAKGIYNGIRAYIKIEGNNRTEIITDTAIVMNEMFSFKGTIKSPSMRSITINSVAGNIPFVLEPGITNIEVYKDSIRYSKVDGSPNNKAYNLYRAELRENYNVASKLRKQAMDARKANDSILYMELYGKNMELRNALNDYPYEFIDKHPDSDFSLLLLEKQIMNPTLDIEKIKNNLSSLRKVIAKNEINKRIGQKIKAFIVQKKSLEKLNIGEIAPDFSAQTPEGNTISLNEIKGKATIIDFWAAWCGPCRRENPNVVKVYNKYHKKGLEIISVSLDGSRRQKDPRGQWLKAIKDDKLTWHHVSSLTYFNDPVARLYSINSIPATFILDSEGKIVAKGLRGLALEKQISKLLD